MREVDSREPGKTMEAIKYELVKTGWEIATLKSGDFRFTTHDNKLVGITRKTISDLLGSMTQNFGDQLDEMLEYYDICYLNVEGKVDFNDTNDLITGTNYTYEQYDNFLQGWFNRGFILLRTASPNHTVKRLNQLYAYFQKPYHVGGRRFARFEDRRVYAFPSRFLSKGKSLLDLGLSITDCGLLDIADLKNHDGIGDKAAETI